MKEEALKLADKLKEKYGHLLLEYMQDAIHSESMIRNLIVELDKQDEQKFFEKIRKVTKELGNGTYIAQQTKPLSDEEIKEIFANETGFILDESPMALLDFARAIEERHGIK